MKTYQIIELTETTTPNGTTLRVGKLDGETVVPVRDLLKPLAVAFKTIMSHVQYLGLQVHEVLVGRHVMKVLPLSALSALKQTVDERRALADSFRGRVPNLRVFPRRSVDVVVLQQRYQAELPVVVINQRAYIRLTDVADMMELRRATAAARLKQVFVASERYRGGSKIPTFHELYTGRRQIVFTRATTAWDIELLPLLIQALLTTRPAHAPKRGDIHPAWA